MDFDARIMGNDYIIVTLPYIKLAFYQNQVIAFVTKTKWTVRVNQWGMNAEKVMRGLETLNRSKHDRLPQKHFFWALQQQMEHPRVLLDTVARQAKESLKDL